MKQKILAIISLIGCICGCILLMSGSADAAELNQPNQLISGFNQHRVSYSIKMSKTITLGLQNISGTAKLWMGPSVEDIHHTQIGEVGFDYSLGLGVVVGQEVGVTQQLYFGQVPPQWYVLIETSGNADFELVSQIEKPW